MSKYKRAFSFAFVIYHGFRSYVITITLTTTESVPERDSEKVAMRVHYSSPHENIHE